MIGKQDFGYDVSDLLIVWMISEDKRDGFLS